MDNLGMERLQTEPLQSVSLVLIMPLLSRLERNIIVLCSQTILYNAGEGIVMDNLEMERPQTDILQSVSNSKHPTTEFFCNPS